MRRIIVPSETTPGKTYTIVETLMEGWLCSCPSFTYRRRCKHLDKYIDEDGNPQKGVKVLKV